MMGSMAAFTVNDALMKSLSDDLALFQTIFLRGILVSIAIAILAWRMGAFTTPVAKTDWWPIFLRTVGEAGAAFFFISALFNMPLANATAILQALPLTVTLAAAFFLHEPVGWRRMIAIGIGFLGVIIIVRPGLDGFNIYSVYCLAAVVCVTLRDIATRQLSKETHSMTVTLVSSVFVMVATGCASLGEIWGSVTPGVAVALFGTAVSIFFAYVFSVMVMRTGDVAFVAPFRYTALLFALVLGYVMFGEWPDLFTLFGATLVVTTGFYAFFRERQLTLKSDNSFQSDK